MKIISLLIFVFFGASSAEYSAKELKCLVCRATIEEIEKRIEKINPNKKIQIGGFRIDENGDLQEKIVPFARSKMHLSEVMDEICETMEDYARAKDKKTGKLVLLKLIVDDGMNPEMSNVDLIQDSDLNETLGFYCQSIVEEFEEEIYEELKEPSTDPPYSVCTKASKLCGEPNKEEL